MRFINLIYFNIYRWYFEMKISGRNVNPPGLTSMAFGLCIGGWLFLIDWAYSHFINNKYPDQSHILLLIFIVLISGGIVNSYYSNNYRYLRIYDKFISSDNLKKSKGIGLSFLFIFLPYILLAFLWVLFGA